MAWGRDLPRGRDLDPHSWSQYLQKLTRAPLSRLRALPKANAEMRNSSGSVRGTTAASLTKAVPVTARVAAAAYGNDMRLQRLGGESVASRHVCLRIHLLQKSRFNRARKAQRGTVIRQVGDKPRYSTYLRASVCLRRVADVHVVALLIVAAC
jgi:hypothetical protein